jgi:transposase-like protein
MGRKSKVPVEKKIKAVEDYLNGIKGTSQILFELQINDHSFSEWVRKYKLFGREGFINNSNNRHYSESLKLQAVKDYLDGVGSQSQICSEYKLSHHSLLQLWIKKYNSHEIFKSHNIQGDRAMTKGRKTTYKERTEIVEFCIANNDNYQLTADKFQVSYQQVYTWVQKYKTQGYEALSDGRGRRKNSEELSESEKYTAQLNLLKAENKRLEMENHFLKKLDEVERRREIPRNNKKSHI